MTVQIAVRLPDDLVDYVDQTVREAGGSRASVVAAALRLYRMRLEAERDARILRQTGDYDDLVGLTAFASFDDD